MLILDADAPNENELVRHSRPPQTPWWAALWGWARRRRARKPAPDPTDKDGTGGAPGLIL